MKRILLLSLIACGASLTLTNALRAQDAAPAPSTTGTGATAEGHKGRHGGGERGGNMLERLTTELSLTTDQQTQLKPILEAGRSEMKGIQQDTTLSQKDKREKMKAARESMNSKISAILTADQQTKFTAMQEKKGGRRRGGNGGGSEPAASASAKP